jgi:uncharacterized repeat protein (TIGR03803 family)
VATQPICLATKKAISSLRPIQEGQMKKAVLLLVPIFLIASFAQAQTFTTLFTFNGGTGGAYPEGTLLRDSHGNLYGVALNGGTASDGLVFKVDSAGTETVLHNFTGTPDGQYPPSGLVHDPSGNFYGITENVGAYSVGTAYEVNLKGQERVLHSFGATNNDGVFPVAPLVRDSAGNLYGAAQTGGSASAGVVFKLNSSGVETILHSFTRSTTDGNDPVGGLTLDSAGNLYGTTYGGGTHNLGTVFKIDSAGKESLLYSFGQTSNDGSGPEATLLRDSSGNLYGTTYGGGTAAMGTVFKIDSSGKETVLHSFAGGADGANPNGGLVQDPAGNLYGVTPFGGTANYGVLYEIDTTGKETVLHTFSGLSDGGNPQATLTRDAAGNLYGAAGDGSTQGAQWGALFKFTP